MKNHEMILLATAAGLALLGVMLQRRHAAQAAQAAAVVIDPMAWITEWGKNV